MKNKIYFFLFVSMVAITLLFARCKKGDTGPAGPTGSSGTAGAQGPKGDTGTANVIYSAWLDVTYTPDSFLNGNVVDTIGYFANITAPSLSSTIISNGELKVYMNLGTSTAPDIVPLPYLDIYSGLNISVEFYIQKIALYSNANVSTVIRDGSKYLQFRYIFIPGGVASQSFHPIDWNNYNKVRDNLGLTN